MRFKVLAHLGGSGPVQLANRHHLPCPPTLDVVAVRWAGLVGSSGGVDWRGIMPEYEPSRARFWVALTVFVKRTLSVSSWS